MGGVISTVGVEMQIAVCFENLRASSKRTTNSNERAREEGKEAGEGAVRE